MNSERKLRVVDLLFKRRTRFVVSQVHSRFFVELFPQKGQLNKQDVLPTPNHSPTSTSNSELTTSNSLESVLPTSVLPIPVSEVSIATVPRSEESKRKELFERQLRRKQMNNKPPRTDVLIITALPKERDALLKCRDLPGNPNDEWEIATDDLNRTYYWRSFECDDEASIYVAVASSLKIGEQATTNTANRLARYLEPKCLAMVGICAGNRHEGNICLANPEYENREENVRLGDIIIAERVFNFDYGKLKTYYDTRHGHRGDTFHDLITYNLCALWKDRIINLSQQPINWTSLINCKRPKSDEHQEYWLLHEVYKYQFKSESYKYENPYFHPAREDECPDWGRIIGRLWANKLLVNSKLKLTGDGRKSVEGKQIQASEERDPLESRVHFGPVGTGSKVIRDSQIFDYLSIIECRILGIEMEGNAIGAVAEDLGIPMIVIKGVSDYADHTKNNQFHEYAAEASARFLIAFIREHWPPR